MKATHKGHYMKVNPRVFDTNDNASPAKQACYKQRPGSLPLYCRKPKATVPLHDQESAPLLQWLDSVTTKWGQKSWKGERQRTRCVYWATIRSQWEKCGGGRSSSNQRRHGAPSEGHTRTLQCRNVDPKRECRSHSCSGIHKTAEGFSLLNVVNGTLQASFTRKR